MKSRAQLDRELAAHLLKGIEPALASAKRHRVKSIAGVELAPMMTLAEFAKKLRGGGIPVPAKADHIEYVPPGPNDPFFGTHGSFDVYDRNDNLLTRINALAKAP
jgi:hypothetical protein